MSRAHYTYGSWRHGVVVSSVDLINEVNQYRVLLVLECVTVIGWVNHLGM